MREYNRRQPLFDQRIPVSIQTNDPEEKQMMLTIRMLQGVTTTQTNLESSMNSLVVDNNSSSTRHSTSIPNMSTTSRALHIELTDDYSWPFFLYTLDVNEANFHLLKQDQKLLVDFEQFSQNLIELLNCCLPSKIYLSQQQQQQQQKQQQQHGQGNIPEDPLASPLRSSRPVNQTPQSYLATLDLRSDQFSIVETNQFKYLTHLSLKFKAGTDESIQHYLASRLHQLLSMNAELDEKYATTLSNLQKASEKSTAVQNQLQLFGQERDNEFAKLKLFHANQLAEEKQRSKAILESLQKEWEQKLIDFQVKSEEQKSKATNKLEQTEAAHQTLLHERYEMDYELKDLQKRCNELTKSLEQSEKTVQLLKEENISLNHVKYSHEKSIDQLTMEVQSLRRQMDDKEELRSQTESMVQASEMHKKEMEQNLILYRNNHATLQEKLEASIAEITKGNSIIEKIQRDNHNLKAKMKMKNQIIKQQEHLLTEKKLQLDNTSRDLTTKCLELKQLEYQLQTLKAQLEDAQQKLEESNKLLASNQQVITWLNKEINNSQYNQGSVSSFRSSSTPLVSTSASKLVSANKLSSHHPSSSSKVAFNDAAVSLISNTNSSNA